MPNYFVQITRRKYLVAFAALAAIAFYVFRNVAQYEAFASHKISLSHSERLEMLGKIKHAVNKRDWKVSYSVQMSGKKILYARMFLEKAMPPKFIYFSSFSSKLETSSFLEKAVEFVAPLESIIKKDSGNAPQITFGEGDFYLRNAEVIVSDKFSYLGTDVKVIRAFDSESFDLVWEYYYISDGRKIFHANTTSFDEFAEELMRSEKRFQMNIAQSPRHIIKMVRRWFESSPSIGSAFQEILRDSSHVSK